MILVACSSWYIQLQYFSIKSFWEWQNYCLSIVLLRKSLHWLVKDRRDMSGTKFCLTSEWPTDFMYRKECMCLGLMNLSFRNVFSSNFLYHVGIAMGEKVISSKQELNSNSNPSGLIILPKGVTDTPCIRSAYPTGSRNTGVSMKPLKRKLALIFLFRGSLDVRHNKIGPNSITSILEYLTISLVLLIGNSIKPSRFTQTNSQMRHQSAIVGSMPMCSSSWSPDNVPLLDTSCLSALIAYPSGSLRHLKHLVFLMGMPVTACARCEGDIGHGKITACIDHVEPYISGESRSDLGGAGSFFAPPGMMIEVGWDIYRLGCGVVFLVLIVNLVWCGLYRFIVRTYGLSWSWLSSAKTKTVRTVLFSFIWL